LLAEVDRLADVIAVAVGERNDVHALGLLLAVRALRVRQPGIHVKPLCAGRVAPEARMSQPRQLDIGHEAPFGSKNGWSIQQAPSDPGAKLWSQEWRVAPCRSASCWSRW